MVTFKEMDVNIEKFDDHDKFERLVDGLENAKSDAQATEKLVEDFRKTIDKYQEQPELLEPYLPKLISRLTLQTNNQNVFKYLYQIIKTVGFKSVSKHFPHDTSKLTLIVDLLAKEDPEDRENWQNRFVLTVWLSIVILTPFDLAKFDAGSQPDGKSQPISERIYSILLRSLLIHDSSQHATAYCMAKFFSRPDISGHQQKFLDEFLIVTLDELRVRKAAVIDGGISSTSDVKLIGHLRTLAYVYKFLPRQELQKRSKNVLEALGELDVSKITGGELVNHLLIKLVQRVGLALLPKRLASWHYKRGARILGTHQRHHAQQKQESSEHHGGTKEQSQEVEGPKTIINADLAEKRPSEKLDSEQEQEQEQEHEGETAAAEAELLESADWLESILSMLFVAAQNSQTKIRWSAAKGLARLASRLDRPRASDVLDMVLGNFFDLQSSNEYAWHGGCLTLAEMSRQGLILVEKLDQVMGVIGEAIIYDKIKGSFAVGAHVRESACYVIWAMARTYDDQHLRDHLSRLSINLMCTIVFDRELQCRRAASATFQELIGRQGAFDQEALALLAQVDYQNVGQRQFAYLDLAQSVARIGGSKYYVPFIEHLLAKKLGHWDLQIRRLASQSLGLMMLHVVSDDVIESKVLQELCQNCEQVQDLNLKQGALLGVSSVIRCLVPLGRDFQQERDRGLKEMISNVVQRCEKQLKSKQQAANFLDALCQLISASELAKFTFEPESPTIKQWEQLVWQALDSDHSELRQTASDAYLSLYRFYFTYNKTCQDRLLTIANKRLSSPNESQRCGALRCLSKLGLTLASGNLLQPSLPAAATTTTTTTTSSNILDQSNLATSDGGQLQSSSGLSSKQIPTEQQLQQQQQPAQTKQASLSLLGTGGEIRLDSDTPDIILTSLTSYLARSTREKSTDQVFADAKAECCEALVNFVRLLDKSRLIVSTHWLRASLEALLINTEDYTFDKRGDIGVHVRKAAVKSLQKLCNYLIAIDMGYPLLFESARIESIVSKLLQQCVSYNNSARELATVCFYRLIGSIGQCYYVAPDDRIHDGSDDDDECLNQAQTGARLLLKDLVPHYEYILNLFQKYRASDATGDDFNWRDDSTPIFVELLGKQEYSRDLWLGLMPALGQASELCARQFRLALSDYIRGHLLCDELDTPRQGLEDDTLRRQLHDQVFGCFLQTLEDACLSPSSSSSSSFSSSSSSSSSNQPLEASVAATKTSAGSGAKPTTAAVAAKGQQQRLLTAGLQATDYLLTQGLMNETSSKFQERLVELCWQATKVSSSSAGPTTTTTTDPKRLVAVSRVLCSMLQFQSREIQHKCLKYCLALLASGLASVRAYTAEQLYSNIMFQQLDNECQEEGDEDLGREESSEEGPRQDRDSGSKNKEEELAKKRKQLDEAMELLSLTQWTEPIEKVRPIRAKISSCLESFYSIES